MAKCECKNIAHGHGSPCDREAGDASDKLCKECHDQAAEEFFKTTSDTPPYVPPR
jgi:hypothetical protein